MLNNEPAIDDFTSKKLKDIEDVFYKLNQLKVNMEVASDLSRRSSISPEITVGVFNSSLEENSTLCDEVTRLVRGIKLTLDNELGKLTDVSSDKLPVFVKENAELKDNPVTMEMLEIAKTEDLYHFAGNLNAILENGYCKKCKLTPNGCVREGCGEEGDEEWVN